MAAKTEQETLGKQFSDEAQKLIWNYGDVKYKWYDRNYCYPYIEPGTNNTPEVSIPNIEGTVYVTGEFESDTTLHIHPDSVVATRLSICHQTQDQILEPLFVTPSPKGIISTETLPDIEQLQKWTSKLGDIRRAYEKQGIKPNSPGMSYSCGDSKLDFLSLRVRLGNYLG